MTLCQKLSYPTTYYFWRRCNGDNIFEAGISRCEKEEFNLPSTNASTRISVDLTAKDQAEDVQNLQHCLNGLPAPGLSVYPPRRHTNTSTKFVPLRQQKSKSILYVHGKAPQRRNHQEESGKEQNTEWEKEAQKKPISARPTHRTNNRLFLIPSWLGSVRLVSHLDFLGIQPPLGWDRLGLLCRRRGFDE